MYRFLLLYRSESGYQRYAEGLIHYDNAVYVRGFYKIEGKLFENLYDLECYLRDECLSWDIQMIDQLPEKKQKIANGGL